MFQTAALLPHMLSVLLKEAKIYGSPILHVHHFKCCSNMSSVWSVQFGAWMLPKTLDT